MVEAADRSRLERAVGDDTEDERLQRTDLLDTKAAIKDDSRALHVAVRDTMGMKVRLLEVGR